MHPAICDSSLGEKTAGTSAQCKNCSGESGSLSSTSLTSQSVYDLLNAGPRNRFTIKTNSGWLIVHNCGYQGGVAGFQTFAKAYGVRMADHWITIQKTIRTELVEKAHYNLEKFGRPQLADLEISETEWLASETCKLAWRDRHPATTRLWYALQEACKEAILNWGTVYPVGQFLRVKCMTHQKQRWMLIKLPSGRYLTYFDPRLIDGDLTYMGDAADAGKTTRQWTRVWTHGGKLTGNCCQTVARDILMPALLVAEEKGYLPVLSVHDEAITEVPDTAEYTSDGLVAILAANAPWNKTLPLAAAGFECTRYRKD